MTIAIKTKTPDPPQKLLDVLAKVPLRYTEPVDLQYHLSLGGESCHCGVFGDGDNGAYEWFIWQSGVLETSDCAYGIPEIALRDVLNKVYR